MNIKFILDIIHIVAVLLGLFSIAYWHFQLKKAKKEHKKAMTKYKREDEEYEFEKEYGYIAEDLVSSTCNILGILLESDQDNIDEEDYYVN